MSDCSNALMIGVACMAFVPISFGATTDTPQARAEIEKYGNAYSGSQIGGLRAIYKEHLVAAGNESADVVRDVSYGPHERHRLDILRPKHLSSESMPESPGHASMLSGDSAL